MSALPIVIIGGGLAAASALRTLRQEGYEGPLTLLGEERHLPYERPALSKEVLKLGHTMEQLHTLSPEWYEDNQIQTRLGSRVVEISPRAGSLSLADGSHIAASGVLLATGSRPRQLQVPRDDRIRYLHSYEDALAIRAALRAGDRIVVVGAGFIGAEVASAARTAGVEVVMLEALSVPFGRVLGSEVGSVVADIHRANGVDVRTEERVTGIEGGVSALVVSTDKTQRIEASLVVVGVGVSPRDELARGSGMRTDDGVLVDAGMRTSAPRVFAAGDVVRQTHRLFSHRLRVEHYESAIKQGSVAARNLIGGTASHDDPPWFWSDQYEHNLQYAGNARTYDRVLVRGSLSESQFSIFYLDNGRLVGSFGLNRGPDVRAALRAIGSDVSAVADALTDEGEDLRRTLREVRFSTKGS